MRIPHVMSVAALCLPAFWACGYPDPGDPWAAEGEFGGVRFEAEVYELLHGHSTVRQVGVRVIVTNPTEKTVSFSHPVECPVRIRLYRASDFARVYDESRVPCNYSGTQRASIPPGEAWERVSGGRQPWGILGDSLPPGRYRVAALLALVSESPVEIDAAEYYLPHCEVVGFAMQCTYPDADNEDDGDDGEAHGGVVALVATRSTAGLPR